MGIVEGAVIGGVVGGVVSVVVLVQRSRWQTRFLADVAAAKLQAARALVDKRAPSPKGPKVPLSQLVAFRDRLAALAILNEPTEIERELASRRGGAAYIGQCELFGLACLQTRSEDSSAVSIRVDEALTRTTAAASRLQGLVVKKGQELARLCRAASGREPATLAELDRWQRGSLQDTKLAKAIFYCLMVRAAQAVDADASVFAARLSEITGALL